MRKGLLRRFGVFVLLITILIGVSGCMGNSSEKKSNSAEKVKDEALEYLNKNYDDTFSPVTLEFKSWAYKFDTITFSSKKYDDQLLNVYRKKVDGKYYLSDDYFKLYMNDEANEYFQNIVTPILGEVVTKVSFQNFERPTELDSNSTFTDYLEANEVLLELYIFSDKISFAASEEQYRTLLQELINKKLKIFVYFIAVNPEGESKLKSASLDKILDSETELFKERKDFVINKDFSIEEFDLVEFSNGGE